ncbi:MAG: hypothetical protein IPH72_11745 [Sandaracinaceae bacterium]|nr:hypothetical protein [Sandaracinaceae bacterium]
MLAWGGCGPGGDGSGGTDELADLEVGLIHVTAFVRDEDGEEVGERELWDVERVSRHLYWSCEVDLQSPQLQVTDIGERPAFAGCVSPRFTPNTLDDRIWTNRAPGTCEEALCEVHVSMCVADRLMELARGVGTYESREHRLGGEPFWFTVEPQTAEANTVMMERAVGWAERAGWMSAENLRRGMGRYGAYNVVGGTSEMPGLCDAADLSTPIATGLNIPNSSDSVPFGESFAVVFAQATGMVRESGLWAARLHRSVADSQFSRNSNTVEAAQEAWVDPLYSRARAAHVLVGGHVESGIEDVPRGFCPMGRPSTSVRKAMDVIRAASPKVRQLRNAGTGGQIVDLLVAGFMEAWAADAVLTREDLLGAQGLSEEDYLDARTFMELESDAFWMGQDDDGTQLMSLARPSIPPGPFLLERVRRGENPDERSVEDEDRGGTPATHAETTPMSARLAERSVADYIDYAASVAHDLAPSMVTNAGISEPLLLRIRETLAPVMTDWRRQRPARLEACAGGDTNLWTLWGETGAAASEYRLVYGLNALRCAVNGYVDGEPCTSTFLDEKTVATPTESGPMSQNRV